MPLTLNYKLSTKIFAQSKINLYLCTVNLRRGCLYIVSGGEQTY